MSFDAIVALPRPDSTTLRETRNQQPCPAEVFEEPAPLGGSHD